MKIAVLDDYLGLSERFAGWGDMASGVTVFRAPMTGDLVETLASFDVICAMRERTPLPADLIARLPNLKLIVTTGMRNAAIAVAEAKDRGITVSGTASRTTATSHLAMTLILAATRGLYPNARSVEAGGWQAPAGRDLHGLTLGLIGLGRLGAAVAALARPFGMEIVAWSENLTDARCHEVGVQRVASLTDLMARADVASIHLVLSDRSKGLVGAEALAAAKLDAVLVNTSRGPIIDTPALLDALRTDRLGCAALDVFDAEPLPADHPLRDEELIRRGKLLLTPHIGYGALRTYELMYRETGEAVHAFAAGSPIRTL